MPLALILAWSTVKAWASAAWGLWSALPGPVKAAILIALAAGIGVWWGEHDGARKCNARITASIEAARAKDDLVSAESKAVAAQQVAEAQAREAAVRAEVKGYAEDLTKRTEAACLAGADAARYNDGLGVSDDPVQQPGTKPATGDGHRAVTVPLPPRRGQ